MPRLRESHPALARLHGMRARELVGVLFTFALVAVVWTWPVAARATDHVPFDPRFQTPATAPAWSALFELDRARQALAAGRAPFHTDRVLAPGGASLVREDLGAPWAWLSWPLARLGGDVLAYNVTALALLALAATATFGAARALGLTRPAAWLAGFGWAFSPWSVQSGLEGLAVGASPWLPLAARLASSLGRGGTPRSNVVRAGALGLVLGAAAWTSTVVAAWIVPTAAGFAWLGRRARRADERRTDPPERVARLAPVLAPAFVGLAVAAAVVAPLALELARAGPLPPGALEPHGPRVAAADFVTPPGLHPLLSAHPTARLGSARPVAAESPVRSQNAGLYLGVGLSTLCGIACFASKRGRALAVGVLVGLVATWDPGGLGARLWVRLPGLEALRTTALWLPVATLPLALGAGVGFDELVRRGRGRVAALGLALLVAGEWWVGPLALAPYRVPAVVRTIARGPGDGGVLVLPLPLGPHVSEAWALEHDRPLVFRWLEHGELERSWRWHVIAPDLDRLVRALAGPPPRSPLPDPAGLSFDLEALDVDHVLAFTDDVDPAVGDLLDAMERWERGPSDDGLAWWHRSGLLVP